MPTFSDFFSFPQNGLLGQTREAICKERGDWTIFLNSEEWLGLNDGSRDWAFYFGKNNSLCSTIVFALDSKNLDTFKQKLIEGSYHKINDNEFSNSFFNLKTKKINNTISHITLTEEHLPETK